MEKKNILFVNDEMTMGGVARILNTLLKLLDKDKYNIDLLVLHKRGELLNEITDYVNVIEGSKFFNTVDIPLKECKGNNLISKIKLLFYMKTDLIKNKIKKERTKLLNKKYDVEFCAKEGFCTIFTAFGDSKKKLNWVQTDYKVHNFSSNHMKLIKEALNYIDMNIACSEEVKESFEEIFKVTNIVTINNPIDDKKIRELSDEKIECIQDNKIKLITVARFHQQKRIDRIIKAYAKYKDYYSLTIVGGGELKEQLFSLAKQLNVYEDIKWIGILSNPYSLIKSSDLFIMSSDYEGYPTITIEALLSETPVLTTNVAGVKEQITADEHGFIIDNNQKSLENKLDELKDRKSLLIEYKNKLSNYRYDNELIMNEICKLF